MWLVGLVYCVLCNSYVYTTYKDGTESTLDQSGKLEKPERKLQREAVVSLRPLPISKGEFDFYFTLKQNFH